jgi:3-deoxy-D-manno-octulosonic-acid transferase
MSNTTSLIRCLYGIAFTIILPFVFLRLLWLSRKNRDYRHRWLERVGLFTPPPRLGGLWLHAVSVGESIAAIPIIKQFQKRFPNVPITVTTTTPTGSKQIQTQLGNSVFHVYFPYDIAWAVKNFLKRCMPAVAMIMETELWPSCLSVCQQQKLPVVLANARLSDLSIVGYQRLGSITTDMLHSLTMVAAQSEMDGERFVSLGLPSDRMSVTGNVKYDIALSDDIEQKAQAVRNVWGLSRPVVIAASTHAGEEELVLEAFSKIRMSYPECLLMLVPRHRERFQKVADVIQAKGFSMVSRSSGAFPRPDTQVYLGDTMGELPLLYAASDIAFVGGSFAEVGGHNTLEPAAVGVPSIVGPHVHNFVEITQKLKAAGALLQVNDSQSLASAVLDWLKQPSKRIEAGAQGRKVVVQNRGAVNKLLDLVVKYFS